MEMLQLRYFYESAMAQSFSKTAQKYMVPASSVSASVRRLEQELGTELFVRTGNRIELNEKGKRLLLAVSNTLTQLDVAVNAICSQPTEKQTISILARCTRETIARHIVRFHRMYPSVSFKMTVEDNAKDYDRYDVVVSDPDEVLAAYVSFPWRKYALHIESEETDPLCGKTVSLSQLQDRLFVTTNTQRGGFQVLTKACEQQGFTPKVLLECSDYSCRNRVLLSGGCLGLNVGNESESRTSGLRYLSVSDFKGELVANVYYKKEKYEGNVKRFLDFLKSAT